MALEEIRSQLAKVKADNDRLLIAIKDRMNAIMQADKGGDIKNLLTTQLARFDSRKTGIRLFYALSGEEYFKARIKNEEDFAGFAGAFESILEDLEDGIRSRSLNHDTRTALLNRIKTMSDAWIETKNERWTTELNESQLKTQLLALLAQTRKDIEALSKYSVYTDEDTTTIRERATQIYEKIEGYQSQLGAGYIADTQENYEIVAAVKEGLGEVRGNIAGFATTIKMQMALEGLDEDMGRVAGAKSAGRKLNPKKDVVAPFVAVSPAALKNEEVDELGCAIYMIQQLGIANETFAAARAQFGLPETIPPMPLAPNLEMDPQHLSLSTNMEQIKQQIRTALERGDQLTAARLTKTYATVKKALETYDGGVMKKYDEELTGWQGTIDKINQNPYAGIIALFEKTYAVFSGKSLVSYKTRAKIMAEQEVYDMSELFQRYIDASMKGETTTLINIRGLLKTVITEYNAARTNLGLEADPAVAEIIAMEKKLDQLDAEMEKENGNPLAEPELSAEELALLDAMKAQLAKEDGTTVTATPVTGDAPKVNTEPEPKIDIDAFLASL